MSATCKLAAGHAFTPLCSGKHASTLSAATASGPDATLQQQSSAIKPAAAKPAQQARVALPTAAAAGASVSKGTPAVSAAGSGKQTETEEKNEAERKERMKKRKEKRAREAATAAAAAAAESESEDTPATNSKKRAPPQSAAETAAVVSPPASAKKKPRGAAAAGSDAAASILAQPLAAFQNNHLHEIADGRMAREMAANKEAVGTRRDAGSAAAAAGSARRNGAAPTAAAAAGAPVGVSKSIAFYAHKGGVGKSTLMFEAAMCMATGAYAGDGQPQHVVIIDADSQLNTSFKLLARMRARIDDQLTDALLNQEYDEPTVTVKFRADGDNDADDSDSASGSDDSDDSDDSKSDSSAASDDAAAAAAPPLRKPTIFSFLSGTYEGPFDIDRDLLDVRDTAGRVKFLLGSPILHSLELQLSNAIGAPAQHPLARNAPKLFMKLLQRIQATYAARGLSVMILVDLSPSADTMNQNMLLSCDFFVLPCTSDDNSLVSLRLLFSYLHRWRALHKGYLGAHHVKFLFVVLNRYKTKDTSRKNLTHTQGAFKKRIRSMTRAFINATAADGQLLNSHFLAPAGAGGRLFLLQDGVRFMELCSQEHLSLPELTTVEGRRLVRNALNKSLSARDNIKVNCVIAEINSIVGSIMQAVNAQEVPHAAAAEGAAAAAAAGAGAAH